MSSASNPYVAPAARVEDRAHAVSPPAIWNPQAAAAWSIVLSPVFGSFLHMLNWRALGEENEAAKARGWFALSLAVLIFESALALLLPATDPDWLRPGLSLAFSCFG